MVNSRIIESGQVLLPRGASFLDELEKEEVVRFPYVQHDDQLDALSQMLDKMKLFQTITPHSVSFSFNDIQKRNNDSFLDPYQYNRNNRGFV